MKGVHPFIAATILVLVTVVIATLVSSWTVNVSSERAKTIINATQTKLSCQYAGFLVKNVTYACNSACFTGSPYAINASIENTGSSRIIIENMFISLSNGISYRIDGNQSSISTGDIITKSFNAIRVNTSSKIPTETMDTRSAYANDTNTIGLWHFDDGVGNTTADSSRANTGTLYNGSTVCNNSTNQCPLWNASSQFGYGITFDGINDYVLLDSRNFSNVTGTVEAWVNMQNNNVGNNYTIFSTPSQISNTHDGLLGLWHFSQNSTASGGVTDSSPYGSNGTALNGPLFTNEGRFQTAWNFDGINAMINISTAVTSNVTNLTISLWFQRKRDQDEQSLIGKYDSATSRRAFLIFITNSDVIDFIASDSSSSPSVTPPTNVSDLKWHHVAAVFRGGNSISAYLDGTETRSSISIARIDSGNGADTYIGHTMSGVNNRFNGTIDEVAIWNRSFSSAEIRDIYLGGLSLHKMADDLRFVAGNVSLSYNVSSWTGWHHVAGTYTSSAAALYADGASVNASSNRGLVILGNNSYIGGLNGTISFNGTIDEVRISNMSRAFNATLQYNITLLNISAVRVYNSTNVVINASTSLGGISIYNNTLIDLPTSSEYRVEVDTSDGVTMEKWYPYRPGGACVATSSLDKIQFSTTNCPEVTDTYPGTDVTFANCAA